MIIPGEWIWDEISNILILKCKRLAVKKLLLMIRIRFLMGFAEYGASG